MSLRTRLTLAGGGAVVVALAIASLVIYVDVRSKLRDQIDFSLIQSARKRRCEVALECDPRFSEDPSGFFQVVPNLADVTNAGRFGDRSTAEDGRRADDRGELDDAHSQGGGGTDSVGRTKR